MKKVLSLLLCLLMCVSIFSGTAAEVMALEATPNDYFTVKSSGYKNDRIKYTISLNPNLRKVAGVIVKVEFDKNALAISESSSGAAGTFVNGDYVNNVNGIYEKGFQYDSENIYSFAFMNPNGINIGENGKDFLEIVFNAVGETRPKASVKIYCEEFVTIDENDENDLKKGSEPVVICNDSFDTLSAATNVSVDSTTDGLNFSWKGVIGADYYDIYRKDANNDWKLIKTVDGKVTEYNDTTIVKGTEYYYSVQTRNEFTTIPYDETGIPGFNFGTIDEISIGGITENGIIVNWSALNGAEKYEVYKKTAEDSSWTQIGVTEDTSFESTKLVSGTTYYFTVKAVQGRYHAAASVDPASCMFISVPSVAYVEVNYDDVVINWSMIKGAKGYKVFRKGPADADYVCLTENYIEGNAYVDADVVTGETYLYKLQAIGDGVESAIAENGYSVTKLPIPDFVNATLGVEKITVSWQSVDLAENYVVYRNGQPIRTVQAPECKIEDKSVESGETYTYAVATVAGGLVTEKSVDSQPILYLDAPVVDCVLNGADGMEVVYNVVNGAEKYEIYRKTVGGEFQLIGTASLTNYYVDKTAVSGVQYIYGVKAVCGETVTPMCESNMACRLSEPVITSLSLTYDGILVEWGKVAGAEKYHIWQKDPTKDWSIIATVDASELSYTHSTPKQGRNNFYAVQAVCGDNESTMKESVLFYLAAPKITFIDNATSQITLRWTKSEGVEYYRVYRRLKGESKWSKLADTEETSYKDKKVKAGVSYEYTVKAFDGYDIWSDYNRDGWGIRFLTVPTLKSAKSVYGGLQVSWSKVTGASKYVVYRKTTKDGEWEKLKTVKTTSYTDKTAKSNKTYYYAVRAYYSGSYSYLSDASSGISCKYLAAPTVKAENTSSGIKVSWNEVDGATKYIVYRKAGSEKSWTKVKTTTSTSYTDKNVKNKTTYKYAVKAYNNSSLISGYNSSGLKIVFLSMPKTASATSSKSGITVKWSAVSGVTGYVVYRKTGSGSYAKLATVKGASKVSYLDKTAKKGKTYTYCVKAYYSSYKSASKATSAIKDKY